MAEKDYFGHVGPDGSEAGDRVRARGYYWSAVGENIAAGPPTPEQVVAKWLSNAGYCANLMSPRFVHMGAGHESGGSMGTYWSLTMARPLIRP
jgi:uncharacterized protein YkwD